MPTLHRLLFAALLALAPCGHSALGAQVAHGGIADSVQRLTEFGFASLRVEPVDDAISLIDHALNAAPTDSVLMHYRGYALYRKGALLNAQRRKKEAKLALDSAEASLVRAGKTLLWPENAALLAATLGQRIGLGVSPFTAMRLGTRANGILDAAAREGPRNPRVFLVRGIGALFKPRLFGGGADKAVTELELAVTLFQDDSTRPPNPVWGRSEVFQWLGMARARQGRVADAQAAYARALEIDPGNFFVRDSLLPALHKESR